jgi:signal recognition particle receptor subunit beta
MIIQYDAKVVQAKIVYYGPAMSGKTTSVKALLAAMHPGAPLQSIETSTGRTLFFDFGTLDIKGLEWTIKLLLVSTTGQDFYQSTRPAILAGVDGVVFVADAQRALLPYNQASWTELHRFLATTKNDVPAVICLNKVDLEDTMTADELRGSLSIPAGRDVPIIPSIASRCVGVQEAFTTILGKLFPSFRLGGGKGKLFPSFRLGKGKLFPSFRPG